MKQNQSVNAVHTKSTADLDNFSLHLENYSYDPDEQTFQAYSNAVFEPSFYHQAVRDP